MIEVITRRGPADVTISMRLATVIVTRLVYQRGERVLSRRWRTTTWSGGTVVSSNRIQVLLSLPNRLFLDALRCSLSAVGDLVVVAVATDRLNTLELVHSAELDVAVIDYRFVTVELARTLNANCVSSVLICSADGTPPEVNTKNARCEIVLRDEPIDVLVECIRAVGRRGSEHGKGLTETESRHGDTPPLALTNREIAVLQHLAEGLTSKEISTKLHVSVRTVDNHRSHLSKKLGIHSAVGLTRYAIRHGIVSP